MHIVTDSGPGFTASFAGMRDYQFTEQPEEMMSRAHLPDEMRYEELSRVIKAMERSGTDVNEWKVERALKIAIPVTCIIIALFGAPLATSNQRGGAAFGIAISLATTVTFLMAVQVTKAVGGTGMVPPDYAAWIPNATFAVVGLARSSSGRGSGSSGACRGGRWGRSERSGPGRTSCATSRARCRSRPPTARKPCGR
jgi:lipopolysaccharide export system permease protein